MYDGHNALMVSDHEFKCFGAFSFHHLRKAAPWSMAMWRTAVCVLGDSIAVFNTLASEKISR